jgi:YegS/Rv2252/BmrU family lipid kinase
MTEPPRVTQAFVVLNPMGGGSDPERIRQELTDSFGAAQIPFDVLETTPETAISAEVRAAVAAGADLVVAAGGDGTVSLVADGLLGQPVPLAIIPAGTANVLARVLDIPIAVPEACALAAGRHRVRRIDAMRVGESIFLLHIGVGVGSVFMRDTPREAKRRFGRLAYIVTAIRTFIGFQPQRFMLVTDGARRRVSGAHIVLANGGLIGSDTISWGDHIQPDDGVIDICIVRAATLRDYFGVVFDTALGRQHVSQRLHYLTAREQIALNVLKGAALPIQGDGEMIGDTPLLVEVVPSAVGVVTPEV